MELDESKSFALAEKIPHAVIETKEAEDERYLSNPPDRCYYCKRELFSMLEAMRKNFGFRWLIDGTNADDSGDYRPGMRAALGGLGFPVCRVRHHGAVARIEVPSDDIPRLLDETRRGIILEKIKGIGFTYVTVDIEGYRTGSMNEVIGK